MLWSVSRHMPSSVGSLVHDHASSEGWVMQASNPGWNEMMHDIPQPSIRFLFTSETSVTGSHLITYPHTVNGASIKCKESVKSNRYKMYVSRTAYKVK